MMLGDPNHAEMSGWQLHVWVRNLGEFKARDASLLVSGFKVIARDGLCNSWVKVQNKNVEFFH